MLFPASLAAEHLEVHFVGIKGERTQVQFRHLADVRLATCANANAHDLEPSATHSTGESGCDAEAGVQRRREAVNAVYELTPMADSSRVPGTEGNAWGVFR
jgi:hypothetical protein